MPSFLWKIYALTFLAIQLWSLVVSKEFGMELLATIWSLMGCIALIGYAFNKPLGRAIVWKIYFTILLLVGTPFIAFLIYGISNGANDPILYGVGLALLIQVPYWYALWHYAYKSKQIWVQNA